MATLNHLKFNKKANNALQMVMLRCQKPVQFTVANLVPLTIETFGMVGE